MDLDLALGLVEAFCQEIHEKAHTPPPEPKIGLSLPPSREIQSGFISTVREASKLKCQCQKAEPTDEDDEEAHALYHHTHPPGFGG